MRTVYCATATFPALPATSAAPAHVTVKAVGPPVVVGDANVAIPDEGDGSTVLQPAVGTAPAAYVAPSVTPVTATTGAVVSPTRISVDASLLRTGAPSVTAYADAQLTSVKVPFALKVCAHEYAHASPGSSDPFPSSPVVYEADPQTVVSTVTDHKRAFPRLRTEYVKVEFNGANPVAGAAVGVTSSRARRANTVVVAVADAPPGPVSVTVTVNGSAVAYVWAASTVNGPPAGPATSPVDCAPSPQAMRAT